MRRASAVSIDWLMDHVIGGDVDHPMADELRTMMAGSSRFVTFANAHRDKIRKKLRTAGGVEGLSDVRTELQVAHLLLGDRHVELAFEEGGTRGGPDFTIRYRGGQPVACEVTRMRRPPGEVRDAGPVLVKLRQLRPSVPNVLIVAIDGRDADELDVEGGVRRLRRRADEKDEGFFVRRGFAGTRDFYIRFLRLGAVVTWYERAAGVPRSSTWINRSARIPVPERVLSATVAALE